MIINLLSIHYWMMIDSSLIYYYWTIDLSILFIDSLLRHFTNDFLSTLIDAFLM